MKVSIAIGILGALVLCSQLAMAKPRGGFNENGNPVNTNMGATEGAAGQEVADALNAQLMAARQVVANYRDNTAENLEDSASNDDTDLGSVGGSAGSMTYGTTGTSGSGDGQLELWALMGNSMDGIVTSYEGLIESNHLGAVQFIRQSFRNSFHTIMAQEFARYDNYLDCLEFMVLNNQLEAMHLGFIYSFLTIMATEIQVHHESTFGIAVGEFLNRLADHTQAIINDNPQSLNPTQFDDIATDAWNGLNPDHQIRD
ncbi:hypothetical protein H4R35_003886 [Dimargaris xerosporica]|nr:hypothetical protein H4R35_003886 [Dimargaris xerosporica]